MTDLEKIIMDIDTFLDKNPVLSRDNQQTIEELLLRVDQLIFNNEVDNEYN